MLSYFLCASCCVFLSFASNFLMHCDIFVPTNSFLDRIEMYMQINLFLYKSAANYHVEYSSYKYIYIV